jgi:hypothetical protein
MGGTLFLRWDDALLSNGSESLNSFALLVQSTLTGLMGACCSAQVQSKSSTITVSM